MIIAYTFGDGAYTWNESGAAIPDLNEGAYTWDVGDATGEDAADALLLISERLDRAADRAAGTNEAALLEHESVCALHAATWARADT